jgi:hypothetical protein
MVTDQEDVRTGAISGEAPVHELCALYAAQVCPHLSSPRARLGDEFRKGEVRVPKVRFIGFTTTHAVHAMESQLQKGTYVLHFEQHGVADEFSYQAPEQVRDRFADRLAHQHSIEVSESERELIRLFNRVDDGDDGDVVTGAALAAGAVFAKDVFQVQGMKAFGKNYAGVGALLLKGSRDQIEEFASTTGDEAFRAVGKWILERDGELPTPLKRWRRRGEDMVRWDSGQANCGPGRAVAKNAPCPCGSGRKARRCHPSGVTAA